MVHFGLDVRNVDSGDPDALEEASIGEFTSAVGRFNPRSRLRLGDVADRGDDGEPALLRRRHPPRHLGLTRPPRPPPDLLAEAHPQSSPASCGSSPLSDESCVAGFRGTRSWVRGSGERDALGGLDDGVHVGAIERGRRARSSEATMRSGRLRADDRHRRDGWARTNARPPWPGRRPRARRSRRARRAAPAARRRRWPGARRPAGSTPAAAIPSRMQASNVPSRSGSRCTAEYSGWLLTSGNGRWACSASTWAGVWLDTPTSRILPSSRSAASVAATSAGWVNMSGRWTW